MSVSRQAYEGEGRGARGRDLGPADPSDLWDGHPVIDEADAALEQAYLDDQSEAEDYARFLEAEAVKPADEAVVENHCPTCRGSGGSDDYACGSCRGTGRRAF